MNILEVPYNYGGKLFCDQFSTLLSDGDTAMHTGEIVQVNVNSVNWGTAKVEAVRHFLFKELSPMVSFINMGTTQQKQAHYLNKHYGNGQTLDPHTIITHIVCTWVQRNIEDQTTLLTDWWSQKNTAYAE